jgi:small subunit ribosomal protein S8
MAMTDPIADMLTRLRNANTAYHETVAMPSSSVKARIAEILQKEGYIAGYKVTDNQEGFGKTLVIDQTVNVLSQDFVASLSRDFAYMQSRLDFQKFLVDLELRSSRPLKGS